MKLKTYPFSQKVFNATEKHIKAAYQYVNEINIVVAGLKDLGNEHLAAQLQAINSALTDSLWNLEKVFTKSEE